MLVESVEGVIGRHMATDVPPEGLDVALWQALEEVGFCLIGISEERGGSGGGIREAAAVARVSAAAAVELPITDTMMLGGWLLGSAGLTIGAGPAVAASCPDDALELRAVRGGWTLDGVLTAVPWGRHAAVVAALADSREGSMVVGIDPARVELLPGRNLAGEPRDGLRIAGLRLDANAVAPPADGIDRDSLWHRGALARSISMVGAMQRVLTLTVEYSRQRTQFGRPIGRFQAVQQQLAELAGQLMAAEAAVGAAVEAVAHGGPCEQHVAVAKARAGAAAGVVAAIGHQIHGAIGFTDEHPLHRFTRRLWSWREEFGAEPEWQTLLGRRAAACGGEGLYELIVAEHESPDPERV
jgi:acyl-CoA dehydrogenase